MATTVLFLGATGYIGGMRHPTIISTNIILKSYHISKGSVLISLIKAHPEVIFKALVRSDADIPLVAATGATTTKDSLKDYEALSEKVAQADIIFNGADCDDVALNESILKGLKKRFNQGRGVGTLVHTSGTASFMDGGKEGRYNPEARVWTVSFLILLLSYDISLMHPPTGFRRRNQRNHSGLPPWEGGRSVSTD